MAYLVLSHKVLKDYQTSIGPATCRATPEGGILSRGLPSLARIRAQIVAVH